MALAAASGSQALTGIVITALYLGFFFLIGVAIYAARRYLMSRTQYRGIRFGMEKGSLGYAVRLFAGLLLSIITLLIATPYVNSMLYNYMTNKTLFGGTAFQANAKALPLLGKWLLAFFVPIALLVAAFFAVNPMITDMAVTGNIPYHAFIIMVIPYLILIISMVWYSVAQYRYFTRVTTFGAVRFSSTLSAKKVISIYLVYLLIFLPVVVIAGALALMVSGFDIIGFMAASASNDERAVMGMMQNFVMAYIIFFALIVPITSVLNYAFFIPSPC